MSNYKQALQNFFLRNLFSVQWKLRGIWNDLYKPCSMSSGKEFSDMHLQRTNERSKRGSIAVGCFVGCEPWMSPVGHRSWVVCFITHSEQHQTKINEQRTHYFVWKTELMVLLVFSEPCSVCDGGVLNNCYPERQQALPVFAPYF